MVKFHIVENSEPSYLEKYEEFIELYLNNSIRVEKIREILGWSSKVYCKARNKAIEEGRITNRNNRRIFNTPNSKKSRPKYYSKDYKGRYNIRKSFNRKTIYYGGYPTEEIAKYIVAELKKVDWDKKELYRIKQEAYEKYGK